MLKTNYKRYKLALKKRLQVYSTKVNKNGKELITPQLRLKIWLIIINAFLKH